MKKGFLPGKEASPSFVRGKRKLGGSGPRSALHAFKQMLIFIIHYHRHLALHLMGAFQKHSNSISPPLPPQGKALFELR